MAVKKAPIKADEAVKKLPVLGTFEGECADANITNNNGLDITRPVWENVFNSDEYKQAIELGWYIGFLGHPDDPNCMDFRNACIVMTEGYIDDNGKIYGKFNLIDTPVGRVVKAFIDAGVVFGISVRGAGDIVDNSVDPDTFVFRGFDLVTFPAYPESIPTFKEIAASTDLKKQAQYKAVCAAVKSNLHEIKSVESLGILQSQFAAQSDEYKAIEARKVELQNTLEDEGAEDITEEQLNCMTDLYLEQVQANSSLFRENELLKRELAAVRADCDRKVLTLRRITSAQISDMEKSYIASSDKLKSSNESLRKSNLKYKQKIDAADRQILQKDSVISSLRKELDETVREVTAASTRASNLDAVNAKLQANIRAAQKLVEEYQEAYANLYASALGVRLKNIPVTATTSVSQMQSIISSTSTANISTAFVEPEPVEVVDEDADDDDEIITM